MYYFETVGHRGAPMEAPENTLLSFQRAIDIGVDWIEFDLAKGRVKMDMEIKEAGIEGDVIDAIRRGGIAGQCMVSSFIYDPIKKAKELSPEVTTAAIMDKLPGNVDKCLDKLFNDAGTRTLVIRKKIALGPFVGEARRPIV